MNAPARAALPGILALAVIIWRWERFAGAFAGRETDRWIASLALMALIALSTTLVVRAIQRGSSTAEPAPQGPWHLAGRRFRSHRLAVWSMRVILLLCGAAVLAPILAPHDPTAIGDVMRSRFLAPSWSHPFGTDEFGRDLFSRALYGARISLAVGLLAMLLASVLGTSYGALSGYLGGQSNFSMRHD